MTQQVRKGYRNHKKGTWAAVLVVLAAAALVAIPMASGAADKTYTIGLSPSSVCSSATDGGSSTQVILTNTARSVTLGSAEIYFPANSVHSVSLGKVRPNTTGAYPGQWDIIGNLNNLGLVKGGAPLTITVHLKAGAATGSVRAVVKQSNNFNDSAGTANTFSNPSTWPQLTVAACKYYFSREPVDSTRGATQTVKVIYGPSLSAPTPVPGSLTLSASQTVNAQTTNATSSFSGLSSTAQDSTNAWSFSVVGNVSGQGYSLTAGTGSTAATSESFAIYDCIPDTSGNCTIGFTPTGDGTSGAGVSGSGIASPIALAFSGSSTDSTGKAICTAEWDWTQMSFPPQDPDGRTTFDGIVLSDFGYAANSGYVKVTTYLRNDLYVQTSASQTNDIQICAGAKHSHEANGSAGAGFFGRNGIQSQWDATTGLYWGVLARLPNCSKKPDANGDGNLDPVLCAWGTQTINGVDYRTATVLVPYDWDWKNVT